MSNSSNNNSNNNDSSNSSEQYELKELNDPRSAIEQSIELGTLIFFYIIQIKILFSIFCINNQNKKNYSFFILIIKKKFWKSFLTIAGNNEATGIETFINSTSANRFSSSYSNNFLLYPFQQNSQISVNEEESGNNSNQDDSALFGADEYNNYNDILNPHIQQYQQGGEVPLDNIMDNLKTLINNEK